MTILIPLSLVNGEVVPLPWPYKLMPPHFFLSPKEEAPSDYQSPAGFDPNKVCTLTIQTLRALELVYK